MKIANHAGDGPATKLAHTYSIDGLYASTNHCTMHRCPLDTAIRSGLQVGSMSSNLILYSRQSQAAASTCPVQQHSFKHWHASWLDRGMCAKRIISRSPATQNDVNSPMPNDISEMWNLFANHVAMYRRLLGGG
jgi:hypothetical protein